MIAYIANPIYDATFKYLMEDKVCAKLLLSALLQKEVVEVSLCNREYPFAKNLEKEGEQDQEKKQSLIKLYRIDFAAKVRDEDGNLQNVIIELQKTWKITETLRFRRYLAYQYLSNESMIKEENGDEVYSMPVVSIYILGHQLADVKKPVIYVRRRYLDQDDNEIEGRDRFIESLTHDSIIVQVPLLPAKLTTRLEKMLSIFNQKCQTDDRRILALEYDDDEYYANEELKVLTDRLALARFSPELSFEMEVEEEMLGEFEEAMTKLMVANQKLEVAEEKLESRCKDLEQKNKDLEQKDKDLEQKDKDIEQKDKDLEQKDKDLEQKDKDLEQKDKQIVDTLLSLVGNLMKAKFTPEKIAEMLSISLQQVDEIIAKIGNEK